MSPKKGATLPSSANPRTEKVPATTETKVVAAKEWKQMEKVSAHGLINGKYVIVETRREWIRKSIGQHGFPYNLFPAGD